MLARTAGLAALRIYAGELGGPKAKSDKRQVEGDARLLAALRSGDRAGVKKAVTRLVYSHTHVVRLRVSQGSVVLADVGGPYILAPVRGTLQFHGRSVGRYVLSVQDDVGYVKLAKRFIGAGLVLRQDSRSVPVEGVLAPGPSSIPDHGPVRYRHVTYAAFSFNASSFPSGPLRISLLMPLDASLHTKSCVEIKASEARRIAQLTSRRYTLSPASFSSYVGAARHFTGGSIYIRFGSRQVAGSTRPGPPRLPASGSVSYRGHSYEVSSFRAPSTEGPVLVYVLVAE